MPIGCFPIAICPIAALAEEPKLTAEKCEFVVTGTIEIKLDIKIERVKK